MARISPLLPFLPPSVTLKWAGKRSSDVWVHGITARGLWRCQWTHGYGCMAQSWRSTPVSWAQQGRDMVECTTEEGRQIRFYWSRYFSVQTLDISVMAKVLNIPAIPSSLSQSCTTVEHDKGKDQWQIFLIVRIYSTQLTHPCSATCFSLYLLRTA